MTYYNQSVYGEVVATILLVIFCVKLKLFAWSTKIIDILYEEDRMIQYRSLLEQISLSALQEPTWTYKTQAKMAAHL